MAGYEDYIGSISDFAGNFEPKGYAFCAGQILPIQNYTALFSILGTTYGGNGINNFALPDLRPTENGQKIMWNQMENPIPAKIICMEGTYPPRN